jgi:hypothetical protein
VKPVFVLDVGWFLGAEWAPVASWPAANIAPTTALAADQAHAP